MGCNGKCPASSSRPKCYVVTLSNPFVHYVQLFHPNWCTIVSPKLVASVGAVRMQNLADGGGKGHLVVLVNLAMVGSFVIVNTSWRTAHNRREMVHWEQGALTLCCMFCMHYEETF